MIKIHNLNKRYKKKVIFENASLSIENPELVYALLGESGSGKTTLFNIIFGLDTDYSGSYKLFDKDAKKLSNSDWSSIRGNDIKMVFQDYKLLENFTVAENIFFSGDFTNEELDDVLEQMDIADLKNQTVNSLSGGQKQRVAIARAAISTPKVLLLDEPTGNLDTMNITHLMKYLNHLKSKGTLIFIITHDESVLKHADVVYKIKGNNIIKSKSENYDKNFEKEVSNTKVYRGFKRKSLFRYALKYTRIHKRKIAILSVPIITILTMFILAYTSFQEVSVASFKNFFSGIDDKTMLIDTQRLNEETVAYYEKNNIISSYDENRIAFSQDDVSIIADIPQVDKVTLASTDIVSSLDKDGNNLNLTVFEDEFPKEFVEINHLGGKNSQIEFEFEALSVPNSTIKHYNINNIDLIEGDFPEDNLDYVLIPDLLAKIKFNEEKNLVGKKMEFNVGIDGEIKKKSYYVAGVYRTYYERFLENNYKVYTSYYPRVSIESNSSEESYNFIKNVLSTNQSTVEYSENIIGSYDKFTKAVGTGYPQIIIVAKKAEDMEQLHSTIAELFPRYQIVSHLDLKKGELSMIYRTLVKRLLVGSLMISLIIGVTIAFLNKGYILNRSKELAILYSLGYTRENIFSIMIIEQAVVFFVCFVGAYLFSIILNFAFFKNYSLHYLFQNLTSLNNILQMFLLTSVILFISLVWCINNIRRGNLKKYLNGEK